MAQAALGNVDRRPRPDLVVLSETSLPMILWVALVHRRPMALLSVMPVLPFLARPMAAVASWLMARGLVRAAADRFPSLSSVDGSATALAIAAVYPRCEPDMKRHFRLDERASRLGPRYAQAYRHASMGFLKSRMQTLLTLRDAEDELVAAGSFIHGLHREIVLLFAAAHGRPPRFAYSTVPEFRPIANLLTAIATLAAAVVAAGRTLRFMSPRAPEPIAFAYDQPDSNASRGAEQLALDIAGGDPNKVLFVFRNDTPACAGDPKAWQPRRTASPSDGTLSPLDAARALVEAAADLSLLLVHLWATHPHHFFAMAKLPVKRIALRSLFDRYPIRAFLSRDDYNTEHIIRTQELRRIGAVSMGINNGMPTAPIVLMHWQYLDFDRYYTFGTFLHETWYRHGWPPGMTTRPIGSWGMTGAQRRRLGQERTSDIVYFCNPLTDPLPLVRAAVSVAAHFPDRTVWVKIKSYYPDADPKFLRYLRLVARRLPNVRITRENPYELMLRCRYAIGGLTTAVPEAAQFGCVALFLDFYDSNVDVLFRHFPDICVTSAGAAIDRIRAVESGDWVYPRERLESLIALHCEDPFRAIASEIPNGAS